MSSVSFDAPFKYIERKKENVVRNIFYKSVVGKLLNRLGL